MNGMDTDDWCPTVDKFLDVKYDERTVAHGKAAAKETLQAELGLPVRPRSHSSWLRQGSNPCADLLGESYLQIHTQRRDTPQHHERLTN